MYDTPVVMSTDHHNYPRRILDEDDSKCGGCNEGQCLKPAISNLSNNFDTSSSSLGSIPSCDCKGTGYVGEHCDTECSLQCENDGKCVPDEDSDAGEESCSCSKAVVDGNPFAGLRCEYGATKMCMRMGSEGKYSFCTNEGECQDIVGDNEQHKDCICKAGFEGSHCEYVVGTAPDVSGAVAAAKNGSALNSNEETMEDNIVFFSLIAVATLIGVLLLAFGIRAHKRRSDEKQHEERLREATEELSMIQTDDKSMNSENDII